MNEKKTQMVHFHKPAEVRSLFRFYVGEKQCEFTDKYQHLGFFLDESMNFFTWCISSRRFSK